MGNWVLSNETVDASGQAVALPAWFARLPPAAAGPSGTTRAAGQSGPDTLDGCLERLNAEGYRQRIVYQPPGPFWPLQFAETGLFLVLSGLLAGFCFPPRPRRPAAGQR